MTLTLRQTTDVRATTKGSALTYAEMDANFLHALDTGIIVVGDDSTGATLKLGDTIKIRGGTGVNVTVDPDSTGSAHINIESTGGGGGDVVDDTTPQLGGNLDMNGNSLVTLSNADINLTPNGTGKIIVGPGTESGKISSNGTHDLELSTNDGTNSGVIKIVDGTGSNIEITPTTVGKTVFGSGSETAVLTSNGAQNIEISTNSGLTSGIISITDGANGDILIGPNGSTARVLVGATGEPTAFLSSVGGQDLRLECNSGSNTPTCTLKAGVNGDVEFTSAGTGGALFTNNESETAYPTGAMKLKNSQNDAEIYFGQYHQGSDIQYFAVYMDPNNNKFTKRVGSFSGDQNIFFGYDYTNQESVMLGDGGDAFRIDAYGDGSNSYARASINLQGSFTKINGSDPYIQIVKRTDSSPPATPTGAANIFADEDSTQITEMFVQDSAGNTTKISPHNAEGDWEYYSRNATTGKVVRVNMEKMIKRLEQITGETFFEEFTPGSA